MRFLHKGMIAALILAVVVGVLISVVIEPGATHASARSGHAASAQPASAGSSPSCGGFWNLVSSPNPPSSGNNTLTAAAAVSPSDAWAVGYSTPASNLYEYNTLAMHWNGSVWSIVPTPNAAGSTVSGLNGVAAIATNNIWAVGYYLTSTSQYQTLIEHWNGTNWTIISSPNPNNQLANANLVSVTAISATDVWTVGWWSFGPYYALAEHWDGSQWSIVATPNQGTNANSTFSSVVALASNNVWAVGRVESASASYYSTLIEQWNGSAWVTVQSPNEGTAGNQLWGVAALSANDIWAVGDTYSNSSGTYTPQLLTEHWNGSDWSAVSVPALLEPISSLSSVAAISSTNVWAVGYTQVDNFGTSNTLIAHWNGSSWTAAASPNPGNLSDVLNGIAATPSGRYLVAVGSFSSQPTTNIQTLVVQHLQTLFRGGVTGTTRRSGPSGAILCP